MKLNCGQAAGTLEDFLGEETLRPADRGKWPVRDGKVAWGGGEVTVTAAE